MGMFDSFFDAEGNDWQTKAFGRNLAQWEVGSLIPGAFPLPFQAEVLGGEINEPGDFVESFVTIIDRHVAAVPTERDAALPLLRQSGGWAPEIPARVVATAVELDALSDDTVIRDGMGDVGVIHGENVWYPETAPIKRSKVAKHYLPATVLWVGGRCRLAAGRTRAEHPARRHNAQYWEGQHVKTIEEVRDGLDGANNRINEAMGRAISIGRQDIATVLLEAGEIVDTAIDDLSEIDLQ